MISLASSLAVLLALGPPDGLEVQSPAVSPTQPQPGEPAIAPAHIDAEAAETEPALATPEPGDPALGESTDPVDAGTEPEPAPEPEPDELPSWQSEPSPPPGGGDDLPVVDEWGVPVAPPPDNSPPRGVGLYAGAGILFGAMISRQWITSLTDCDDLYCGWRGNFDRVMSLGVMGFAAGGGWLDGRRGAYFEQKNGDAPKSFKGRRAAGWTLFAVGLGGLVADTVLYHLCYDGAKGPYTQLEGFRYTCSPVASVVILDFSTLFGAVGLGLGVSAESRLRNRGKFEMTVAPFGGRGQAGLSLSGRF